MARAERRGCDAHFFRVLLVVSAGARAGVVLRKTAWDKDAYQLSKWGSAGSPATLSLGQIRPGAYRQDCDSLRLSRGCVWRIWIECGGRAETCVPLPVSLSRSPAAA